jgi:hypothetical protein
LPARICRDSVDSYDIRTTAQLRTDDVGVDAADTLTQLLADLDEAIELLRAAGETHWLAWLERDRARIAAGDVYGLDSMLGAFGGMGSFNDLILAQGDANAERMAFLRRADDRLWDLRDAIASGCQALGGQG